MRLTRLEQRVMQALWASGPAAIREIHEALPGARRPAYTTIQTVVYRLEAKKAVRRVKKIGNAHVFDAIVTRASAERTLVDDLLGLFGGRPQPLLAHLIDTGQLTRDDLASARKRLRDLDSKTKEKAR